MGSPVRSAAALLIAATAGYAALMAFRFAYAEFAARVDTPEALATASQWVPANADYRARIATLDATRTGELRSALRLNPTRPAWWTMLAVQQEQDGDLGAAEESLLQANRVCQYYVPRWTMAAYYYRHENKPEYVRWARAALSVGYGDPDSLFRMAQRLGLPPGQMARTMVPRKPDSLSAFLRYLLRESETRQAYATARDLMAAGSKADRDAVLEASEALFAAANIDEAVDLWNRLATARWIASVAIDPAAKTVDLAGFGGDRLQRGFDWRYSTPQGVSFSLAEGDGSLCVSLSGRQPERCELLSRYLPLPTGKRYELSIGYRLEGIAEGSGIEWLMLPVTGGRALSTTVTSRPAGQFTEQALRFETPAAAVPLRLILRYERAAGTTRAEGNLWIRSIRVARVQ